MGEIATIRKKRSRHYTTLGNELLRDARLSWKARGLFCYLWSHSDNFRFSIEKLTTKASDGRDSTASGLAELQKLGYLVIERVRGPKGRFIRAIWTLTEDPESFVSSASTPHPENPDVVPRRERETGVPVKPSRTTEALSRRTTTTTGDAQRSPPVESEAVVVVNETRKGDDKPAGQQALLVPPQSLSAGDQAEAIEMLRGAAPELAQQILDEIEGLKRAGRIENWRGLLHTLLTRGFTPNRCRAIESERAHRAAQESAARQRAAERARLKPADPATTKKHMEAVTALLRSGSSAC